MRSKSNRAERQHVLAQPNTVDMAAHFKDVSPRYRELRTFDAEPLIEMVKLLPSNGEKLTGFDIGCGTGRYSFPFLQMLLQSNLTAQVDFSLIDASTDMLAIARQDGWHVPANLSFICGSVDTLSGYSNYFDFGMTTNAIHHFDTAFFLECVRNALKSGGRLFVYTRTQEQNRRIIWGMYFPKFAEHETRLLWDGQIEDITAGIDGLRVANTLAFSFNRISSLKRLLEQVREKHYSTFRFYSESEFRRSVVAFESALRAEFPDTNRILHTDENVLYVLERT
ncbi:MAG: class I SAM-dependent methyltransferase [Candidatus Micrarchaeota archaeon]